MAALNTGEWIHTYFVPYIQSIIPSRVYNFLLPPINSASPNNNNPSILNAPSNLHSMRSRFLLFLSCSSLLISFVWLSISISLYPLGIEYQVMNSMYESRWLPSTILLVGCSSLLLSIWKFESFFILCSLSSIYNCASCFVVVLVYSIDFRKALYMLHPPITTRMSNYPRRKYLQLCGCMIVVALLALFLGILILNKLKRLSILYFRPIVLHPTQRSYLLFCSTIQLPFVWFSIFVSAHVIGLQFSYVQQYMIQELLCALILHLLILIQIFVARQKEKFATTNNLILKLILFLNLCQTVQELFYAWNSYYILLYIHSSKAKLASGGRTDQYLMAFNFFGHFLRTYLSASTAYNLSSWLNLSLIDWKFNRCYELSRGIKRLLILLSISSLLLSLIHFSMDIFYTVATHVYRTLIAFTGISVFYLSLIGLCSILFLRTRKIFFLIISLVFTLLLLIVSLHGLYIYLDVTYHRVLLSHLETLGKNQLLEPSLMHFFEAFLSFSATIFALFNISLVFRLLHIDSRHDRRDLRLKKPLLILFLFGLFQLILTIANSIVFLSVNDEQRVFQSMLAYGILDTLSTLILSLVQIYVSRPSNNRLNFGLFVLLFLLICESLTTYNYLSTKTAYVQLLIVFNRMFAGNKSISKNTNNNNNNRLANLFPNEEVTLMIVSHVLQLLEWFLVLASLTLTGTCLELLYEQRKTLKLAENVRGESEVSIGRYTVSSIISSDACTSSNNCTTENGNECKDTNKKKYEKRENSYDNPVYDKRQAKKDDDVDCCRLLETKSTTAANEILNRKEEESLVVENLGKINGEAGSRE